MIERERKYLVAALPPALGPATHIRQGYLAVEGEVEVRLRAADDGRTLTVKGGSGRDRTEVELDLGPADFDELWPLTEGRRLEKDRHRVSLPGGLTAEVDLYTGRLHPLRVVEVEFDDGRDPDAFDPPDWFDSEITTDSRYSNSTLATAERPPDQPSRGQ